MLFASFKSTLLTATCVVAVAALAAAPETDAARPIAELGRPVVQQFPVRTYKGPNMTWAAVQDRAGVLYVGSVSCVLAYDGVRWATLPTGGDAVRAIAVDAEDRIWVGGVNELGYLADDGRGGRTYVSLADRLPTAVRRYGDCHAVIALPHGVYFVTAQHWLRWHNGEFTWGPLGSAGRNTFYANRGFALGGELVVHTRGEPLRAFDGERWSIVCAAPELLAPGGHVVLISALPDGAWLLGTATDGFWRLQEGRLTRWAMPADAIVRQYPISEAVRLRAGAFALARHPHDVLVLDDAGRLLARLDADRGLQSSVCLSPFQDRHGDLWLMLDSGLARVTWPPHLSLFDRSNGLGRGFIRDIVRHAGRLYVATRNTLCVLRPADAATGMPATFETVPGFADVWRLKSTARGLLVTSSTEIRFLRPDGETELVAAGGTYRAALALGPTADLVIFNATAQTLLARRTAAGWSAPEPLADLAGEPRLLALDRDGSVWINTLDVGLYRIVGLPGTASADGRPRVEHYPGGHGLPSEQLPERPPLAVTGDRVVFLDQNRIFCFDSAARFFTPFATLPAELRSVAADAASLTEGAADALWVRTTRRDPLAGPWQGRQRWRRAADGTWAVASFAGVELAGEKPAVLEEPAADGPGTVLWLGGSDALARVELPAEFVRPTPEFVTRILRAESASGPLPLNGTVELPYAHRQLTLAFATDRLDGEHLRFETQLDDDTWSAPAERAEWSAAFLPIGRHELRVRARDADGRVSAPASFAFTVLPPWWLTWWALALYTVAAIGAIAALVLWRVRALRRRNLELEQIVTARTGELRARKQELSSALEAAVAASRAKSIFLAHMSHELRTPLNAILGFAQILQRDRGLNAEQQRRLAIVSRNGEHLLQMINEVLDLSKIEAGHLHVAPRPTDLRQLLDGIADNFAQRAADKGLAFEREIAADMPTTVTVDATKLRQVLVNLLGNAVKFTAAGRVGLRVHRAAPGSLRVRFECTDTGPGLDAAEQAALFEPFSQGAAGRASTQPSTGLGLAISQRLVGAMGGQITVTAAPGRGSCFAFELELPPSHDPHARALAAPVTGYEGARRRLLVVDDEASNREVLRALLAPLGFAIEECADGRACLDAFRRQPADAVLLDLRMPGELDGSATARALRALPHGEQPAIVAVSASVFEEDRQTAIDAGCDTFVPKPFSEERLLHALAECLDLTWVLQSPLPAISPLGVLPANDMEVLRTLARRGDVQALRDRLKRLAARPECAAPVAHLDDLAASFQLGRLRQELRAASDTESPPAPSA